MIDDLEGEVVEPPDDLDDYLDHVSRYGFTLTLADRALCFLRACGFAVAAIIAGAATALFWSLAGLGWPAVVFACCLGVVASLLAVTAIAQLFAAVAGSESLSARRARDLFH